MLKFLTRQSTEFTVIHIIASIACLVIIYKHKLYPTLSNGRNYGRLNWKWMIFTILLIISFPYYIAIFPLSFLLILVETFIVSRQEGMGGSPGLKIKPIKAFLPSVYKLALVYTFPAILVACFAIPRIVIWIHGYFYEDWNMCSFLFYALSCVVLGQYLGGSSREYE